MRTPDDQLRESEAYSLQALELHARLRQLAERERISLVASCRKCLAVSEFVEEETNRVALARCLVALVPDSADLIRSALFSFDLPMDYEVQFSLFCQLDEIPHFGDDTARSLDVPGLIQEYLEVVPTSTAGAAWMAGDLLGHHRDPVESLPVLYRVLSAGRHAAGRLGATWGLHQSLSRCTATQREETLRALRGAAGGDPSKEVRKECWWTIREAE